jgi:5-methylcytosine-specific restriction endonuclease McrA
MAKKKVVRKSKVIKTRNNGTMSESQYFSKIRSSLRQAFRYWKPMQNVLEISSRPSQSLNKRLKKEYQCAHCKNWFKRDDVQIDHVEECGSLNKYEDIVPFIIRLTKEEPEAYQILCKQHHKEKTDKYISSKKVKK